MSKSNQLKSKIGRLIVGRIAGKVCSEEELAALSDGTMSGITLFKDNAVDLVQLAALINQVYKAYEGTPLVAVDQEGGAVQRFDHVLTPLPSAMALGATDDWELVDAVNRINARQSKLLGINCLLAPVMDICSEPLNPIIGTRAFSDDPGKVREWAKVSIKAIADEGVIPVGKHFPGHGNTRQDSHLGLAVNDADGKLLWQRELIPFKDCSTLVPSILVAHVWHPSIDAEELPATLSPRVTTGILREYMKYDGLVMTDDLLMKAITDRWGLGEAAVLALLAGSDLLLVCGTLEQTREVHKSIESAVTSGRLSEERLNQSVHRIEKALKIAQLNAYRADAASENVATLQEQISADYQTALNAAKKAITMVKGELPTEFSGEWVVVAPDHPRYSLDLSGRLKECFGKDSRYKDVSVTSVRYHVNPIPEEIESIARSCQGRNCIYVTFRSLLNIRQQALGILLSKLAVPRLSIAADTPYDFVGMSQWESCLATFDPSDLAMEATAILLASGEAPQGVCPVQLHNYPQIPI